MYFYIENMAKRLSLLWSMILMSQHDLIVLNSNLVMPDSNLVIPLNELN